MNDRRSLNLPRQALVIPVMLNQSVSGQVLQYLKDYKPLKSRVGISSAPVFKKEMHRQAASPNRQSPIMGSLVKVTDMQENRVVMDASGLRIQSP